MALSILLAAPASSQSVRFQDWMWAAKYRLVLKEKPLLLPRGWQRLIVVPPPPARAVTGQELLALVQLMGERPARRDDVEAQWQDLDAYFLSALNLPLAERPATKRLLHDVLYDALNAVTYFKNKYKRARPWQLLPGLGPMTSRPRHAAYPSGHAAQSRVAALALARLMPSCRDKLERLAVDIGRNREVAGLHYRSDTMAGVMLADDLFRVVARSGAYRKLEAAARRELAGAAANC